MNGALQGEMLFFSEENAKKCYLRLRSALTQRYPGMEIRVQKTQISFYDRGLFCCVSRPRKKVDADGVTVTFGLDAPIPDERIAQAVEPYPNRWTHHVIVRTTEEIDDQLLSWIDWAHAFKSKTRAAK